MLREWFTHRSTPASEEARRLGYLKECVAIQARHRRCALAWRDHLERSRRFVLWAAANTPGQDKVTVLGSGGLLDVPLDDLADDFAEVVLVDIVQPPAVKKWAGQYENVRLVEADVTEMAEDLLSGELPERPPTPSLPDGDADLVVSLNLLGQLPLIPAKHLPKGWSRDRRATYCAEIQRQHLRALQAAPGRICLITETKREWLEDETVNETEPALADIKLPEPDETWIWELAPAPEIEKHQDLRLQIAAYAGLFGR